jgi:uracil-DNA glycosylase
MTDSSSSAADFPALLDRIRACAHCRDRLPHAPRPVVHAAPTARLLILSQAPGRIVHETGISFNDRSGDRLRDWLGIDRSVFYDETRIAIMPMGFCYPGVDRHGGDLPPRPECAPLWHPRLLPALPAIRLTLLVGAYAQARYLGARRGRSLSETILRWQEYLPEYFVLPHPSWRNTGWLRRHPWFEAEALPALRRRIAALVMA